jgi:hypothetical protein
MVTSRRSRLPVLFAVALLWWGQGHVRVESVDDFRRAHASACRTDCGGIEAMEPQAAPLLDAFRQLSEAERDQHTGTATISSESLAALHLRRFAGLRAIAMVDRQYGIRWVQTRSSASLSLADLQSFEQACDVLLRRPIESSPIVVNRRELRAGGPGFIVAVPVRDRARVVSFVVGLLGEEADSRGFNDAAAYRP